MSSVALNRLECGFLVGFLEAEAHFAVIPSNGGQSHGCVASVVARDDDTALLVSLRTVTGLGSLSRRVGQRNSRPQVVWTIRTQAETSQLAVLLAANPPIGRKARVTDVWCQAVGIWCSADGARGSKLPALRGQLASVSAYTTTLPPARDIDVRDDFDRGYVTGLIVGDGHLSITESGAGIVVHLRDDDLPLLTSLQRAFGGRVVAHRAYGTSRPAAQWALRATDGLVQAREVLAMNVFPSRKRREVEIWSAAIEEHVAAARAQRARDRQLLRSLAERIRAERAYRPPSHPLEPDRRALVRVAAARDACLESLAEFATEHDGPLDAPTYASIRRERHPEWPTRNTVARHFGGWYAALEAAGLADRAARTADRYANQSRIKFDLQREAQRARVLASVRRCVAELGWVPRAMEYFRWRLAKEPHTPTQATVYNVFRGGWPAVVGALSAAPGPARS